MRVYWKRWENSPFSHHKWRRTVLHIPLEKRAWSNVGRRLSERKNPAYRNTVKRQLVAALFRKRTSSCYGNVLRYHECTSQRDVILRATFIARVFSLYSLYNFQQSCEIVRYYVRLLHHYRATEQSFKNALFEYVIIMYILIFSSSFYITRINWISRRTIRNHT